MVASVTPEGLPLVAGRSCGSCNACCAALTIKEPMLQKAQGHLCRHNLPDQGCGIYATRPDTCRAFYCGWRVLKWVREPLRPDRSGVLIRLHGVISRQSGARQLGVVFMLLDESALAAEGLAESVGAAIAADVPVFLNMPGPPGYTSSQVRVNEVLAGPVRARDKLAVLDVLRRVREMGLSGDFEKIVLETETAPCGDASPVP